MSLFVGNISKNVDFKDLDKSFSFYGSCKINKRGSYAFIEFKNEADAEDAKDSLQGKNLGGLHINIEWSRRSGRFDPRDTRRRNLKGKRHSHDSPSNKHRKKPRDHSRSRSRSRERSSPRYSEEGSISRFRSNSLNRHKNSSSVSIEKKNDKRNEELKEEAMRREEDEKSEEGEHKYISKRRSTREKKSFKD